MIGPFKWNVPIMKFLVCEMSLKEMSHHNWLYARKISVCISSLLPALFLLIICWSGQHIPVIVTLTILSVMFYGSMFSGVFSNHSDLAPNFAGTLMAVTNMLATIPGSHLKIKTFVWVFATNLVFNLSIYATQCHIP